MYPTTRMSIIVHFGDQYALQLQIMNNGHHTQNLRSMSLLKDVRMFSIILILVVDFVE